MIYLVTAESFDRKTGVKTGDQRTERIDTEKGCLFDHCRNERDVKATYEEYWNDMGMTKDVVKVLKVEKASG